MIQILLFKDPIKTTNLISMETQLYKTYFQFQQRKTTLFKQIYSTQSQFFHFKTTQTCNQYHPNILNTNINNNQTQPLFETQTRSSIFSNLPSSHLFPMTPSTQFVLGFVVNVPNSNNQQQSLQSTDLVFNIGTKKIKTQY